MYTRIFRVILALVLLFALEGNTKANPGYGAREKKACIFCHVKVSGGGGLTGNGSKYLKDGREFKDEEDEKLPKKEKKKEEGSGGGGGGAGGDDDDDEKKTDGDDDDKKDDDDEKKTDDDDDDDDDDGMTPEEYLKRREKSLREARASMKAAQVARSKKRYKKFLSQGKKIFNKNVPKLTTTGKTCIDCHKAKELGEKARTYPKFRGDLDDVVSFDRMIRTCIYRRMKGLPLKPDTQIPLSLGVYLKEATAGNE